MNQVVYPIIPATVRAYRFNFPSTTRYYLQDIGITKLTNNTFRISVAGFKRDPFNPTQTMAWYGYVPGLSTTINMENNDYFETGEHFEHYKIRSQQLNDYTGGYFQSIDGMGALFGTPLTLADDCDDRYQSDYTELESIPWSMFFLQQGGTPLPLYIFGELIPYTIDFEKECPPFKGSYPTPELVMPIEEESEITTFYDHITVKDTPMSTNYQIFSIHGQLLQTGTTNPDISTVNISKGIYILRLENGKAFKFVK